jgi:hypothetical protein
MPETYNIFNRYNRDDVAYLQSLLKNQRFVEDLAVESPKLSHAFRRALALGLEVLAEEGRNDDKVGN